MSLCNKLARKKEGLSCPSLCYFDPIFRSTFRGIVRLTIQKFLDIALSKLKFRRFLQVRRFFYRFNHILIYKRIQGCTANLQPLQNLLCTQQPFSTHNAGAPFSIYIGLTKRTILTIPSTSAILNMVDNIDIVHHENKFSKSQRQKESADLSQRSQKFLLTVKLLLIDWNPLTVAIAKHALLLLCMTYTNMSRSLHKGNTGMKGKHAHE